MSDSTPSSELLDAVPLVFEIAAGLEEAEEAYRRLVEFVGEFSDVTVDEIATRLNVSRRHASLIVQAAPFGDFIANSTGGPASDPLGPARE